MKKNLQLVFLLCLFNTLNGQPSWTQKANYPDNVGSAVGFTIGSLGYLGSGWNPYATQDFWSYNPNSNQWSKIADFPVVNFLTPFAITINGEGYVGTGYDDKYNHKKDFWKYNAKNNSWTKIKDFGGVGRSAVSGFEINGKGYIGLGWDGKNFLNDIWEYTPSSDSWKKIATFPGAARISSTGFSINGKGYICSGQVSGWTYLNDLWEYDPQLDKWTQKASLPSDKRMRSCAFVIDKKCFFGTGVNDQKRFNDFWQYDPLTDKWTEVEELSKKGRQNAVAFALNNRGYVGTGGDVGSPYFNDFWEYRLASDTNQCNPMPKANFSVYDICETDSATFLNKSQDADTYLWKFGDGQISNNKSPKYFYSIGEVSKTFNVTLVVSVSNVCSDSITKALTVNANPGSDFSFTTNQNKVDFKAIQAGLTSYKWFFGNGDSLSNKDVAYIYPNSGKFTACLKVTNAANCFSKTCKTVSVTAGISNLIKPNDVKIYPNPNSGIFTLEKAETNGIFTIEIFNQIGQIIHKTELNEYLNTIDLNLASGIYLIRLTNGEYNLNQRVVVTK